MSFDDIDPGYEPPETGEGAGDETIARAVRLLRYLRADKARIDLRFRRETERLDEARASAVQPLENRITSVEAFLTGWLAWRQDTDAAAGRKVRKSEPFPDGKVTSRASARVVLDADADPHDFHPNFRRERVEVDLRAIGDGVRSGRVKVVDDGRMVDPNGDFMPARWVESTSYKVVTDEEQDEDE